MPARCETCHFWVPSKSYVEGGPEANQTGLCRFDPRVERTQAWHWCGRWRAPTLVIAAADTPEHLRDTQRRYDRDAFGRSAKERAA
jgi:hypothetical protein